MVAESAGHSSFVLKVTVHCHTVFPTCEQRMNTALEFSKMELALKILLPRYFIKSFA